MNTMKVGHTELAITRMVKLARAFASRFQSDREGGLSLSDGKIRGQTSMADESGREDFLIIRASTDGRELHVSRADLIEAVRQDQFTPGVEVVDSDIAADEQFQKNIEARLLQVGNHCFGDVGAELERNPDVSDFSLSLVDAYFESAAR